MKTIKDVVFMRPDGNFFQIAGGQKCKWKMDTKVNFPEKAFVRQGGELIGFVDNFKNTDNVLACDFHIEETQHRLNSYPTAVGKIDMIVGEDIRECTIVELQLQDNTGDKRIQTLLEQE